MQYALLIYQGTTPLPNTAAWEALPAGEQQQIYADYTAINKNPAHGFYVRYLLPLMLEIQHFEFVPDGTYNGNTGA